MAASPDFLSFGSENRDSAKKLTMDKKVDLLVGWAPKPAGVTFNPALSVAAHEKEAVNGPLTPLATLLPHLPILPLVFMPELQIVSLLKAPRACPANDPANPGKGSIGLNLQWPHFPLRVTTS